MIIPSFLKEHITISLQKEFPRKINNSIINNINNNNNSHNKLNSNNHRNNSNKKVREIRIRIRINSNCNSNKCKIIIKIMLTCLSCLFLIRESLIQSIIIAGTIRNSTISIFEAQARFYKLHPVTNTNNNYIYNNNKYKNNYYHFKTKSKNKIKN